jgi:galactan 5-O-arabinofuranosyltransferase
VGVVIGILAIRLLDPHVAHRHDASAVLWSAGVVSGLLALAGVVLTVGVSRPVGVRGLAPSAVVAATAAGLTTLAATGLHGTRWGYDGLWSDASFRTEAATRFAASALWPPWPDYAYAGLPAYYPPALPWLEARVAGLVRQPGWAAVGVTSIVLAAVVPVLGLWFWRRVLPDTTAAMVVLGESVVTVDLLKPDEWLVLTVVLPWWLDLVGGHRRADARPWGWCRHGLVLGVLLLWHTYFFLPLALATVAVLGVVRLRGRPSPLSLRAAAAVAAVGLVVAAPYWLPMAWTRFTGPPADNLQMRWSDQGWTSPPVPVPVDLLGAVVLVGVVWLVLRCRTVPMAATLATATVTSYAFFVGGELAQRWDVALLPEKTEHLIRALVAAAAVLAVVEVVSFVSSWSAAWLRTLLTSAVVVVLVVTGALVVADSVATGSRAVSAQRTRYPDGSYPAGGPPPVGARRHPWAVEPGDPSVARVDAGWRSLTGRGLDDRDVLVTDRGDLLATLPVHAWVSWKSIYSHPDGQFDERIALLQRLSACADPRCAWSILDGVGSGLGAADGLVLRLDGQERLVLHVALDRFPDAWRSVDLRFDRSLFAGPWFRVRVVGDVAVVVRSAQRIG